MTSYDEIIQEYYDFLNEKNHTHGQIVIKLLNIMYNTPDEMKVSVAFKLHFMYGYHYGFTKEEVYELWKEKKLFK